MLIKLEWYNLKKSWHTNLAYIFFRGLTLPVAILGFVWLLLGGGTLVIQVLGYLQSGHWEHKPWLAFFIGFDGFSSWLGDPQSWVGLSQVIRFVLEWTPYSIGVFVMGTICAVLFGVTNANLHAAQFDKRV